MRPQKWNQRTSLEILEIKCFDSNLKFKETFHHMMMTHTSLYYLKLNCEFVKWFISFALLFRQHLQTHLHRKTSRIQQKFQLNEHIFVASRKEEADNSCQLACVPLICFFMMFNNFYYCVVDITIQHLLLGLKCWSVLKITPYKRKTQWLFANIIHQLVLGFFTKTIVCLYCSCRVFINGLRQSQTLTYSKQLHTTSNWTFFFTIYEYYLQTA